MEDLLYAENSYAIRGAVFEVYREMGSGFREPVYQECLETEFKHRNLPYLPQVELKLIYKGELLLQTYKPDFVCFEKIIVELRAVRAIAPEHEAQLLNYLEATGMKLGLPSISEATPTRRSNAGFYESFVFRAFPSVPWLKNLFPMVHRTSNRSTPLNGESLWRKREVAGRALGRPTIPAALAGDVTTSARGTPGRIGPTFVSDLAAVGHPPVFSLGIGRFPLGRDRGVYRRGHEISTHAAYSPRRDHRRCFWILAGRCPGALSRRAELLGEP